MPKVPRDITVLFPKTQDDEAECCGRNGWFEGHRAELSTTDPTGWVLLEIWPEETRSDIAPVIITFPRDTAYEIGKALVDLSGAGP